MKRLLLPLWIAIVAALPTVGRSQPAGGPPPPLGTGPFVFDTAEQHKLRAVVVATGLAHPWSMAFLPDGGILVTSEKAGCGSSAMAS